VHKTKHWQGLWLVHWLGLELVRLPDMHLENIMGQDMEQVLVLLMVDSMEWHQHQYILTKYMEIACWIEVMLY
jgi:hypothetical protein